MESKIEGAIMFYNMMRNFYKTSYIMPVKPALIFSTDDKTMWKFEGSSRNKNNKFVLVPSSIKKDNGTRSDYMRDN